MPCSLFCFLDFPLSQLALPSAQCLICRCLSHPVCVGLEDATLTSFVCVVRSHVTSHSIVSNELVLRLWMLSDTVTGVFKL